jgi:hypothetical protein
LKSLLNQLSGLIVIYDMRTAIIIIGVLSVLGIFYYVFFKRNETYQYEVLKEYGTFEVRKYEPAVFTSVKLDSGSYKSVSSKGFNILAGYIFGGNESNKKIAMTTPVSMDLSDKMTMRFLVPTKHDKKDLPKPNNEEIEFEETPSRIVASIRFSGWADDENIEKHRKALDKALEEEGLSHTGGYTFMGYNAPFDFINRRNEVMVELSKFKE